MTKPGAYVEQSLTLVAERVGDPTQAIYQDLFDSFPEFEDLFALDPDNSVRGSMLMHVFDCIEDYFAGNRVAFSFVSSSRIVHEGYGVPQDQFDLFFVTLKNFCQSALGDEWSDGMEAEWTRMLADFAAA